MAVKFPTLVALKQACQEATALCRKEFWHDLNKQRDNRIHLASSSKRGCLFDRHRCIAVSVKHADGSVRPVYEGEQWFWNGTMKDLQKAVEQAAAKGTVVEVTVFGGVDWAESPNEYHALSYEPLVASWEVRMEVKDGVAIVVEELPDADELAAKYVAGVTCLEDLIQKQVAHGYVPTIRFDVGNPTEEIERRALADAYDRRAKELGLRPSYR